jgi:hypothetical protein
VLVDTAGNYTFQSNSSIDLYGYFYKNSFNATNPSANEIASDDDSGGNLQFQFTVSLQPFVTYVLVVTTFIANVTGSYTISAVGIGNVFGELTTTTTIATSTTSTTSKYCRKA